MTIDTVLARRLPDFCLLLFVAAVTAGAFAGGLWASLGIGGALAMFFAVWRIDGRMPWPNRALAIFAAAFLLICAALNLYSSAPAASWKQWEQLVTIFLPLMLLSSPAIQKHAFSDRLFAILPWAAMAGALALGLALSLNGAALSLWHHAGAAAHDPLTRYNRGMSYLVILSLPAIASLWLARRRGPAILFVLILLFPASLTESRAAKLALLLALLTAGMAFLWPRFTRCGLAVALFATLAWPFAVQKLFLDHYDWLARLPNSWFSRIQIWDYMSYRLMERPIFGWGLGSSSSLSWHTPVMQRYKFLDLFPASHPHNALIQLWTELGLTGVAFGIAFALLMLRFAKGLDRRLAPFACGAWAAAFCLGMITYNVWTDSMWAAFALTAFAFALLQRKIKAEAASSS